MVPNMLTGTGKHLETSSNQLSLLSLSGAEQRLKQETVG
jgi:hypothetical protein